jgi:hypothetical protein
MSSLPWYLSDSKREWRLHLPLHPTQKGPRAAVVSKRADDGRWVARIDSILGRPAAISYPFDAVEDAVRWAEAQIRWD